MQTRGVAGNNNQKCDSTDARCGFKKNARGSTAGLAEEKRERADTRCGGNNEKNVERQDTRCG
jgi:hypothetical protein